MTAIVFLWSHLLAALLYSGLFLWHLRHWRGDDRTRPLITAFVVMAVWAMFTALLGPFHFLTLLADCGRHLAFLAFLYGLIDSGSEAGDLRRRPVTVVYAAVAAVIALQIVIGGLLPRFHEVPAVYAALVSSSQVMGLAVAAGALVLVHNVYAQAAPQSRGPIRLTMIALAAMWLYDLHLFTAAYLMRDTPAELFAARGVMLALLVPLFAFAIKRWTRLKVQLSRAATFQSLSLVAVVAYLILMMSVSRAVDVAGGDWLRAFQIALLVAMSAGALLLLPSPRARGWVSVMVQKHFFQHRYDYRQEWLRFTNTVGGGEAPLVQRVVKALADIAGAPAGLLLLRGEEDRLVAAGGWNWPEAVGAIDGACGPLLAAVERTGHVIDFAADDALAIDGVATPLPPVLATLPGAWAGVPLIHCGRLAGLVVIGHPPVRRPLDWEDYDLLRAAGRQAASYLAEARGQEALAQAARFDEFNRRFAFILHDIKNLVSQLSLVARNAERHADNPAFRADMALTLQSSVKKMNDLLARLAPGTQAERPAVRPRAVALQPVLAAVADGRRRLHPITLSGDARIAVLADPAALEQALGHLVQNAIDASAAGSPVSLGFTRHGERVLIEVRDQGCGMTADFVRDRLFQPFASTKDGGFGIGAHEARTLIDAMGGRIDVDSRPGAGTRFVIHLPAADAVAVPAPDRISA